MSKRLAASAAIAALALLSSRAVAQGQTAAKPSYTAVQAARGAELYSGSCAMCHGEGLDDGEFAPALKGPAFGAYWQGKSLGDVLDYINQMMPPTQPGSLGAQGSADVLAHILRAGGAPLGDQELPANSGALKATPIPP